MSNHPNFDRAQAALDAIRQGDYAPSFDLYDDDIAWENGPGAGLWHRASGKDDLALMLMEFGASLGGTFHQDGRCIYADDRVISATKPTMNPVLARLADRVTTMLTSEVEDPITVPFPGIPGCRWRRVG